MLLLIGVGVEVRSQGRSGGSSALVLWWWAAAAVVAGVLLSPVGGFALVDLPSTFASGPSFSWTADLPAPSQLTHLTETSLNVWLTLPLGALGLLVLRRGRHVTALASPLIPVAGETWQGLTSWGRAPAQLQDMLLNEAGIALGAVLAATALLLRRLNMDNMRRLGTPEG